MWNLRVQYTKKHKTSCGYPLDIQLSALYPPISSAYQPPGFFSHKKLTWKGKRIFPTPLKGPPLLFLMLSYFRIFSKRVLVHCTGLEIFQPPAPIEMGERRGPHAAAFINLREKRNQSEGFGLNCWSPKPDRRPPAGSLHITRRPTNQCRLEDSVSLYLYAHQINGKNEGHVPQTIGWGSDREWKMTSACAFHLQS